MQTAIQAGEPRAFYALQPRMLTWDRFYKVYVHDNGLYGALIGGQVHDKESESQFLGAFGPLAFVLTRWTDRLVRGRQVEEELYDRMDLSSREFLDKNKRNFVIPRQDIVSVDADRKWRMHTLGRSIAGTLRIITWDRTRLELILVGGQDMELVLSWIA